MVTDTEGYPSQKLRQICGYSAMNEQPDQAKLFGRLIASQLLVNRDCKEIRRSHGHAVARINPPSFL